MKNSIIAAFNPQFIIGINGKIPWHVPEDLKRFKKLTMGKPIIMGRKTWESLGSKPLPGRLNMIVSSSMAGEHCHAPAGVAIADSLSPAIEFFKRGGVDDEVFIIGGERLYAEALPMADRMYLTVVRKVIPEISDSDNVAYFPIWASTPSEWITATTEVFDWYSFKELERL